MGIELHYAAQLTVQLVQGFENGGHHFPAAESALPTVDKPPADVPSSPRYHCFCVTAHVASLIATSSVSWCMLSILAQWSVRTCEQCHAHRKYACNNCLSVVLLTYIQTWSLHATLPRFLLSNRALVGHIKTVKPPISLFPGLLIIPTSCSKRVAGSIVNSV